MASVCESPIRGLAMRATRVNNCGTPVEGLTGYAVSCGFVSIGLSANIDDGTEIVVRTAGGKLCINEPACRTLTRYDVTIEFCQVDPELFELIAGHRLLVDYKGDSVGHTVDEEINCETGFALEIWSQLAGGDCNADGSANYYYWLLPWVSNGVIGGDITIEDGPVTFTFEGQTKSNSSWCRGPYDVVAQDAALTPGPLLAPGVLDGEHLYARIVELEPPECPCGYQCLDILDVTLPDQVNTTLAAATTALEALQLAVTTTEDCDPTIPAGNVISQSPAAAAVVKAGTCVDLVISTGPCTDCDITPTAPTP